MPFNCDSESCKTPRWMGIALAAAGIYHLLFALSANFWPNLPFDWLGVDRPNHMMLWRGASLIIGAVGFAFLIAARNPIQHWLILLIGLLKFSFGTFGFTLAVVENDLPPRALTLMALDDVVWLLPFIAILWASIRAHTGVPPSRSSPFEISEAAQVYQLSNGQTLAEASESKMLVLVFLRHFGCTFTRQILRGLEGIEKEARQHNAELVLVHMLQNGKETEYLGERSGVPRIADPRCELYRAFGLGKGGFIELFGPRVWLRAAFAIFKGCGVGHLAGDGLQMPGAFLFHHGKIVAAKPARSASDLPDLPQLFKTLPLPASRDTLTA